VNDHLVTGMFGSYANTDTGLVNNGSVNVNSGKKAACTPRRLTTAFT